MLNHIISGIFAGNAVVGKVSEHTSWSAEYFGRIVQKALDVALRKQMGAAERFEVVLDNPALRIHLPVQMPARATVQAINYDARTRRFAAVLLAPDSRPGSVQIRTAA